MRFCRCLSEHPEGFLSGKLTGFFEFGNKVRDVSIIYTARTFAMFQEVACIWGDIQSKCNSRKYVVLLSVRTWWADVSHHRNSSKTAVWRCKETPNWQIDSFYKEDRENVPRGDFLKTLHLPCLFSNIDWIASTRLGFSFSWLIVSKGDKIVPGAGGNSIKLHSQI